MDYGDLQKRLGYKFNRVNLLQTALTHRSFSGEHNERLEFLGDSILNFIVAALLFERYEDLPEGDLSRVRSNLVKQQALFNIAQSLDLSKFLRLGEGELKSGGFKRPSILADAVEALLGAIYIDSGFASVEKVVRDLYGHILDVVDPKTLGKDNKTLLQEYLQARKIALPQYTVVATRGAAHNQQFEVECYVSNFEVKVFGAGGSRRAAEQAAAKMALDEVRKMSAKLNAEKNARKKTQSKQMKLIGIATNQMDENTAGKE